MVTCEDEDTYFSFLVANWCTSFTNKNVNGGHYIISSNVMKLNGKLV